MVRSRFPLWEQEDLLPHEPKLVRQMEDLNARPARWRGALVVTTLDGAPLAIAHVPNSTIAPFTMAVAFLALFAGALVDKALLLTAGGALAAVALFLWFRPQSSETLALEEFRGRDREPDRLPLAVGGPIASGWWAMIVFLSILTTALVTMLASYFYISDAPAGAARLPPSTTEAGLATLLSLIAIGAGHWAVRGVGGLRPLAMRAGLSVVWLVSAAALGLSIRSFPWSTLDPQSSAYASAVLGMVGFQWLILIVLLVTVTIALLWAIGRPTDPRGHTVIHNTRLMAAFTGASAAVVFAAVYLFPRL